MEFAYLTNIISKDSKCLCLANLRHSLLMASMRTCCIVNAENPKGKFTCTISSDVEANVIEIEKAIYERIGIIVRRVIASGYPKELGERFLEVYKPRPRQHLTENIVMI